MVITMMIHIVWAVTVLLVALLAAALKYKIVVGPKVMRADDIAKAFLTVSERIKALEEKDKLREQQVDALKWTTRWARSATGSATSATVER
jgi:hypothetical protein